MKQVYLGKQDFFLKLIRKAPNFIRPENSFSAKILASILAISTMQATLLTAYAQKITLAKSNAPLGQVLQDIRKQSGYQLLYNVDLLKNASPVSIQVKDMELEEVMQHLMKNQPFAYSISKEQVILIHPPTAAAARLEPTPRHAQQQPLIGRVVNQKNEPMPAVLISEKGTNNKTATEADGTFKLSNSQKGATLKVSYLGYESQEIVTNQNPGFINIQLVQKDTQLEEVNVVVSTGYQKLPKERATGSFSFVDEKQLKVTNLGASNFAKGLEGLVPGLLVGPTGSLQIRGVSSIKTATRDVLIVVDGFPIENGNYTINPNDIQNITVLKDAAAASIWGVRASNGVVVINTKNGGLTNGKAIFDVTANLSMDEAPDFSSQRPANSSQYIDFETETLRKGWVNFANADKTPYSKVGELYYKKYKGLINDQQLEDGLGILRGYDALSQQDLIYRKAVQKQINLSVRGGADKYQYYVSSFYTNQLTSLQDNKNDNFNLNVKNTLQLLPKLALSLGVNSTYNNSKQPNAGYSFIDGRPYNMLVDEQGNYASHGSMLSEHLQQGYYDRGYLNWNQNPLQDMRATDNQTKTFASRINLNLDYKISQGIHFTSQYQTELRLAQTDNLQSLESYYVRNLTNQWRVFDAAKNSYIDKFPRGPIFDKQKDRQQNWTFRNAVNLDQKFGPDHELTAIAGVEIRKNYRSSNAERYYNYNPQSLTVDHLDAASLAVSNMNALGNYSSYTWYPNFAETDRRFFSIFANAAHTYKAKYTLSASVRTDQSNLFGTDPKYRYRPLWSAGLSWNMGKEDFIQEIDFVNRLTLRSTYGINGNIGNSSPYPIASTGKNFNTQENMLTFTNPENQYLRPEKTETSNFGIDFTVLNYRLSGSVDYYFRKSYDLLGNSILDPTTGFLSAEKNTAIMKNNGVEFNLNAKLIQAAFQLSMDFNFGYNKNKVTEVLTPNKTATAYITGSTAVAGLPLSYLYSYRSAGLSDKGEPQIYDVDNKVISWSAPRMNNVDALKYVGTMDPPIYGGTMINMSYKGFTFSPQFTFKMGHKMRQSTSRMDMYARITSDIANRWQEAGDEAFTNVPRTFNTASVDSRWTDYYRKADVWDDNASFIRLRSVTLAYQLPKKYLGKFFTDANITGQANNFLLWTANKQGSDPDYVNASTGDIALPMPKNYVFSLNLKF